MANKPTTGRFIASLSLLGCTLSNVQAESCRPWQSSDAQNTALRIGTITVQSQDIFDLNNPKESHWYNRTANRLHIQTDKNVIIHQLLFKPGDPYMAAKLAESERLLRAQRYLKEARIVAEKVCGKHIQVTVHTRDNWTLTTGVSFGQAGGNSNSGIEIDEHNLLGMGKSLTLGYKQDNDRNQIHLGYHDPNLFGTHYQLTAAAQDNSDGNGYQFNLTLPFYQFDSKRAWGISAQHLEQETPIYGQGQVLHKIGEDNLAANFFYGWSEGRRQDRTERYLIGWQYARKGYFTTPSNADYPPPEVQSYPWLGYEYVQDKYTQRENFHTSRSAGVSFHWAKWASTSSANAPEAILSWFSTLLFRCNVERNNNRPSTLPSTKPTLAAISSSSSISQATAVFCQPSSEVTICPTTIKAQNNWAIANNQYICLRIIWQESYPILWMMFAWIHRDGNVQMGWQYWGLLTGCRTAKPRSGIR